MPEINLGSVKGPAGANGFSPTVNVNEINGGHQVTITSESGPETFDVMNGERGPKGDKGDPGVNQEVYSEQEIEIGTWFGEKLYQKSFKYTINEINKVVKILPSQSKIKDYASITAIHISPDYFFIVPTISTNAFITLYAQKDKSIEVFTDTAVFLGNGVCTIKYTKNS